MSWIAYPEPQATHEQVVADPSLFQKTLDTMQATLRMKLKVPKVSNQPVNLHLLYKAVTLLGGFDAVVSRKKWVTACEEFHFPASFTNKSFTMKKLYALHLYHYEQLYFHGRRQGLLDPAEPVRQVVKKPARSTRRRASGKRNQEDFQSNQSFALFPTNSAGYNAIAAGLPTGTNIRGTIKGSSSQPGYLEISFEVNGQQCEGMLYAPSAAAPLPRPPASHGPHPQRQPDAPHQEMHPHDPLQHAAQRKRARLSPSNGGAVAATPRAAPMHAHGPGELAGAVGAPAFQPTAYPATSGPQAPAGARPVRSAYEYEYFQPGMGAAGSGQQLHSGPRQPAPDPIRDFWDHMSPGQRQPFYEPSQRATHRDQKQMSDHWEWTHAASTPSPISSPAALQPLFCTATTPSSSYALQPYLHHPPPAPFPSQHHRFPSTPPHPTSLPTPSHHPQPRPISPHPLSLDLDTVDIADLATVFPQQPDLEAALGPSLDPLDAGDQHVLDLFKGGAGHNHMMEADADHIDIFGCTTHVHIGYGAEAEKM